MQIDVREYLKKTQTTRDKQEEFDVLLELLAPSLKLNVQNNIFVVALKQNAIVNKITYKWYELRKAKKISGWLNVWNVLTKIVKNDKDHI